MMDQGVLLFINHQGCDVMGKTFPYTPLIDDYCFHDGLCSMSADNNRIGLIDKRGNWVINPDFEEIAYTPCGLWTVCDTLRRYGVLDAQGKELLPCEFAEVVVKPCDSCIMTRNYSHLDQVFAFDGRLINACNYDEVLKLEYETEEYRLDEYMGDEYLRDNVAGCWKYSSHDGYYGLMDKKGNMLTLPLYHQINALSADRFLCVGDSGAVILDDSGRECGKKL